MVDTYNRDNLRRASFHRRKDAEELQKAKQWTGAMYLGGYAIECVLVCLICKSEDRKKFTETAAFKDKNIRGAAIHELTKLQEALPLIEREIRMDQSGKYGKAWTLIVNTWNQTVLRYDGVTRTPDECQEFLSAVRLWHDHLIEKYGETRS